MGYGFGPNKSRLLKIGYSRLTATLYDSLPILSAVLKVCQQSLQLLLVGAGELAENIGAFGKDKCWNCRNFEFHSRLLIFVDVLLLIEVSELEQGWTLSSFTDLLCQRQHD